MQLKYNNYTAMQTQLQAARAKLRENTPAFTLLKGAAVPTKATGPKRMIFVIGMLLLVTIILICFSLPSLYRDSIESEVLSSNNHTE